MFNVKLPPPPLPHAVRHRVGLQYIESSYHFIPLILSVVSHFISTWSDSKLIRKGFQRSCLDLSGFQFDLSSFRLGIFPAIFTIFFPQQFFNRIEWFQGVCTVIWFVMKTLIFNLRYVMEFNLNIYFEQPTKYIN